MKCTVGTTSTGSSRHGDKRSFPRVTFVWVLSIVHGSASSNNRANASTLSYLCEGFVKYRGTDTNSLMHLFLILSFFLSMPLISTNSVMNGWSPAGYRPMLRMWTDVSWRSCEADTSDNVCSRPVPGVGLIIGFISWSLKSSKLHPLSSNKTHKNHWIHVLVRMVRNIRNIVFDFRWKCPSNWCDSVYIYCKCSSWRMEIV